MRLRSLVTILAMLLSSAFAACSASPSPAPTPGPAWSALPMPAGVVPVTLTAYGSDVLVGTRTGEDSGAPGLLLRRGDRWVPLPVRPTSGYAQQATWLSIEAEHDGSLVAVGGARGGAHSNVRWTVWRGRPGDGLTEQVQGFTVFGGWGAGDLLAVLVAGSGPMLLGSWQSTGAGLDAAIWLPEGEQWVRQSSEGTALGSRPDLLVGARSGTGLGEGAIVVGSVIPLGDGGGIQAPAAWMSARANAGWRRIDLPSARQAGAASSVSCAADCTVLGWVGERLAAWRVDAGGARRLDGIPEVAVSYQTPLAAPALRDSRAIVLVGEGDAGSVLLRERPTGWVASPGPPGTATQLALVGPTLYAVTTSGSGSTLWTAQP